MREQFIRNLGVLSDEDMDVLEKSHISIAGCGCIGGFTAELLTRLGVGELSLADPDFFDVSNINRQCGAFHDTVGVNKAEALKSHLLRINPDLRVNLYTSGVEENNVYDFVKNANYVVDAIDYFSFKDSVILHRASRDALKFVITAVAMGFGTSVLAFEPSGLTLEEYVGIPSGISVTELSGFTFPVQGYADKLPSYVKQEDIVKWVSNKTIPTISVGQALGPGALVSVMILHLLNRKVPDFVPEYSYLVQFES